MSRQGGRRGRYDHRLAAMEATVASARSAGWVLGHLYRLRRLLWLWPSGSRCGRWPEFLDSVACRPAPLHLTVSFRDAAACANSTVLTGVDLLVVCSQATV